MARKKTQLYCKLECVSGEAAERAVGVGEKALLDNFASALSRDHVTRKLIVPGRGNILLYICMAVTV